MHFWHPLMWLLGELADGNLVAWLFFSGTLVVVGLAFLRDLQANKKKNLSA